jgi:hypothetical protein
MSFSPCRYVVRTVVSILTGILEHSALPLNRIGVDLVLGHSVVLSASIVHLHLEHLMTGETYNSILYTSRDVIERHKSCHMCFH